MIWTYDSMQTNRLLEKIHLLMLAELWVAPWMLVAKQWKVKLHKQCNSLNEFVEQCMENVKGTEFVYFQHL
jgi:hypothetical protein